MRTLIIDQYIFSVSSHGEIHMPSEELEVHRVIVPGLHTQKEVKRGWFILKKKVPLFIDHIKLESSEHISNVLSKRSAISFQHKDERYTGEGMITTTNIPDTFKVISW